MRAGGGGGETDGGGGGDVRDGDGDGDGDASGFGFEGWLGAVGASEPALPKIEVGFGGAIPGCAGCATLAAGSARDPRGAFVCVATGATDGFVERG